MAFATHPLARLIAEGEGQSLDFKKTISSARKIARTLAAFANSGGGSLLIGVKDNGRITGVRSNEEELFMIETAAQVFCKPAVRFAYVQHEYKGLSVVQVIVPQGNEPPYRAQLDDGSWKTYMRLNDQTVLASSVMYEVIRRQANGLGAELAFTELEQALLQRIDSAGRITLDDLCQQLGMKRNHAVRVLANLILAGLVKENTNHGTETYQALDPAA